MIAPETARKTTRNKTLLGLLDHYSGYLALLRNQNGIERTDFSLLQQAAIEHLGQAPNSSNVFRHVIIDEYQDTNPVQERLFFELARGHKNICVVGDDDQALYRFRGATVENFVDFPVRCEKYLAVSPQKIVLRMNYRSRDKIVKFYNSFIEHPSCDWRKKPKGAYRVTDKEIIAHREGGGTAVIASTPAAPVDVAAEIASLVRDLFDKKKVEDPNQVAFLFPSLNSPHVKRMRDALNAVGFEVYAPRAGQFLDVPEAQAVFGLLFQAFGNMEHIHSGFQGWLTDVYGKGRSLMKSDEQIRRFIGEKRLEIKTVISDYTALEKFLEKRNWATSDDYDPEAMPLALANAPALSERAKRAINSTLFARFARRRVRDGRPFTLGCAVTRATSLDWNVLDFFYQLAGFKHFKAMFDLAQSGRDEGPVCNLSLVSSYLARFLEHYRFPISGENLSSKHFLQVFGNFLYVLFRRGEGEYEDAEDPFPRGRIPFITIHQSKGLEFPFVVLGNPRKDAKLQQIEEMVSPLLTRNGEPPELMPTFDVMRMFYVALSRAKNLLVVPHYRGAGQRMNPPFADLCGSDPVRISQFRVSTLPAEKLEDKELPKSYSYTSDYLLYRKCPRQYMLFRQYGFVPSRSQTMFFGSLVHQTLEDLHQHLIASRRAA
jgi:DNA helicase-2/ATP-dependent DNA helicase PcrA